MKMKKKNREDTDIYLSDYSGYGVLLGGDFLMRGKGNTGNYFERVDRRVKETKERKTKNHGIGGFLGREKKKPTQKRYIIQAKKKRKTYQKKGKSIVSIDTENKKAFLLCVSIHVFC